jgi:signal transduction histidine kinase
MLSKFCLKVALRGITNKLNNFNSSVVTNKEKETGLGLALSKTLVNLMNGKLNVKSTLS